MPRTSPVHYIAPSAISITPNANGSENDLAVHVTRGAKIKVYYPQIYYLGMDDANYQEWTLAGRNRRLTDREKPHTIYARLRKVADYSDEADVTAAHADAYLVFAPQTWDEASGEWKDPYVLSPNTSATGGMSATGADGKTYTWQPIPARQAQDGRSGYWWVKLGTVSAPSGGQRTVDLDTGILGTDQYNTGWKLDPDALPTRVEVNNSLGSDVPYVAWGESITLYPLLIEGFSTDVTSRVDHWTIRRSTGDAEKDAQWSGQLGEDGGLLVQHIIGGTDDFDMAPSAVFTFTAWETPEPSSSSSDSSEEYDSSDSSSSGEEGTPVSGSITVLAEMAVARDRTYSEWVRGKTYYYQSLNPERDPQTGLIYIETSYVWHKGCLWMCRQTGTPDEPWFTSPGWQCVQASNIALQFFDNSPTPQPLTVVPVRLGHIDFTVVPYILLGNEDVTDDSIAISDGNPTGWRWIRESFSQESDAVWNSAHANNGRELNVTDADTPQGWVRGMKLEFVCYATLRFNLNGSTSSSSSDDGDMVIMNRVTF